jgi:NADPH:quinone reductase-like Zn-dependent oxidoreductase
MRVIEVQRYGGADELREAEWPDPVAANGKVRVRVAATVVNPADADTRAGRMAAMAPNAHPPIVLGWDFAGTLLDDTDGLPAGTRVAGEYPWFELGDGTGTYAEQVLVEPSWIAPIPDSVDFPSAATLGLNGLTAAQALALTGTAAGQTLLVTGASGGVAGFVVELAAAKGVHVIAAATTGDQDYVGSLGATEVLGRGTAEELVAAVRDRYPDGVDAAYDGAVTGPALIGAVRDGGVFIAAVTPAIPEPERGIRTAQVQVQANGPQLAELLRQMAAGSLRTRINEVRPLAEAADAHRKLEAGGFRGKIVLTADA